MTLTIVLVVSGALNPIFSFGAEALAVNPAQLALGGRAQQDCRILGLAGVLHNNSFTFAQYNRYTGAFLDSCAKGDILSSVPLGGFAAEARGVASAAEWAVGQCAVGLRTEAEVNALLPRDFFELALNGNGLGGTYVAEAAARTQVISRAGIGVGSGVGRSLTVGVAIYAIRGLYCAELRKMRVEFTTSPQALAGNIFGGYRVARGGQGWAFDIGATWRLADWLVSGAMMDISPGIDWTEGVEEVEYRVRIESTTVYDLIRGDRLSKHSSGATGGRFTTYLPVQTTLGVGRRVTQLINSGLLFSTHCDLDSFSVKRWRLSSVTEFRSVRWFPVACSFSFVSGTGLIVGIDGAFLLGRLSLRVGLDDVGGLVMGAKGAGFRLALGYGIFRAIENSVDKGVLRLGAGTN